MFLNISSRLAVAIRRLRDDDSGVVLIYVALLLPILVGGAVLAIDGGRISNLHTTMQKGADSLAMSAAAELDLKPSAINRANLAIANMVANQSKYSASATTAITVSSVRFLQSLPASDASAITATHETTDPLQARFVEVTQARE